MLDKLCLQRTYLLLVVFTLACQNPPSTKVADNPALVKAPADSPYSVYSASGISGHAQFDGKGVYPLNVMISNRTQKVTSLNVRCFVIEADTKIEKPFASKAIFSGTVALGVEDRNQGSLPLTSGDVSFLNEIGNTPLFISCAWEHETNPDVWTHSVTDQVYLQRTQWPDVSIPGEANQWFDFFDCENESVVTLGRSACLHIPHIKKQFVGHPDLMKTVGLKCSIGDVEGKIVSLNKSDGQVVFEGLPIGDHDLKCTASVAGERKETLGDNHAVGRVMVVKDLPSYAVKLVSISPKATFVDPLAGNSKLHGIPFIVQGSTPQPAYWSFNTLIENTGDGSIRSLKIECEIFTKTGTQPILTRKLSGFTNRFLAPKQTFRLNHRVFAKDIMPGNKNVRCVLGISSPKLGDASKLEATVLWEK